MKILFTSDLHIDRIRDHPVDMYRQFFKRISRENADLIVLAGDILGDYTYWRQFWTDYRRLVPDVPTMLVVGNHDLWSPPSGHHVSREDVYEHIKATCKERNIIFLEEDPTIIGKTLFCGSIAWYDYSVIPETTTKEYLTVNKKQFNNDGSYISSELSDDEYETLCRKKLLSNIKKNQNSVESIFVFTHVPVLRECMCDTPIGVNPASWAMTNAYFFNIGLGNKLRKNKKVKLIASGHIHRYYSGVVDDRIVYATCGSDYHRPEYIILDADENSDVIVRRP